MNSLYNLASRQSAAIRADLDACTSDPASSATLRPQITSSLSALVKTIEDYESVAKRELVITKREKALHRAANFHAEVKQFREELARVHTSPAPAPASALAPNMSSVTTRSRAVEPPYVTPAGPALQTGPSYAYQSTTYAPPSMTTPCVMPAQPYPNAYASTTMPAMAPSDPLAAYRMHQPPAMPEERSYSLRESHALREHSFIQNTEHQLDAFIAQGRSMLGNLVEQRSIFKQTRKRLLDAANTMGLSRELIGVIDRMSTQDTILFFVGATITLVIFYLIYRYLG